MSLTSNPLVSIIVPCYNFAHFIGETLDSLLAQSYQNWECIIVDDGSKDNSREVCAAYVAKDNRFIYHYQDNLGLPGARNTGIRISKGEYLQFLDSDDLLEVDKIRLQVAHFLENPKADFVYSDLMYFPDGNVNALRYTSDGINRPWALTKNGNGIDLLKYLIISSVILVPMPLIKKSSLKGMLFKTDLRSCEDWYFWLSCCQLNLRFEYVNKPNMRCLIRLHPTSMTKNRTTMLTSMIEVRDLIDEFDIPDDLRTLNAKFKVNDWIELALVKQRFESPQIAREYLRERKGERSSRRMQLFSFLLRIFPNTLNLKLLSGVRSFMKKTHY